MNFPTTVSIIIVTLTSRVILENIKRSNTHNSVTVYNKESDFNDFSTILVLILVLKSYVYSQNINLHFGTKKQQLYYSKYDFYSFTLDRYIYATFIIFTF